MSRLIVFPLSLMLSACATASTPRVAALENPRVHYVDLSGAPAASLPALEPAIAEPALDALPELAAALVLASEPEALPEPAASAPAAPALAQGNAPASVAAAAVATVVLPAAVEVPAPIAAMTYEVFAGEMLDDTLKRWLEREHKTLDYRAPFRVPVMADAVLPASSLPEAVRLLLTPLWGTRHKLVANEKPGSKLEVTTP